MYLALKITPFGTTNAWPGRRSTVRSSISMMKRPLTT